MELYIKGESLAFECIYKKHKGRVHSFIARRLKKPEDVSEVFQNVFLKLHKSRGRFNSDYTVLQWLFTITNSEVLDFIKKRRIPTVQLDYDLPRPELASASIDQESLSILSKNEQEIVKLRYFSDLDYKEISKILGTSQSNARKILSRSLAKLRKVMVGRS